MLTMASTLIIVLVDFGKSDSAIIVRKETKSSKTNKPSSGNKNIPATAQTTYNVVKMLMTRFSGFFDQPFSAMYKYLSVDARIINSKIMNAVAK